MFLYSFVLYFQLRLNASRKKFKQQNVVECFILEFLRFRMAISFKLEAKYVHQFISINIFWKLLKW